MLAIATIAFYVFVYTLLLKRRTSQNVVWGGAAGCMPVMIGWSAVTGTIGWPALVMFAIIFFWTPPHTWALAMRYKDDYKAAGVPMLPVVATERQVTKQILIYTWLTVLTTLALALATGWLYAAVALLAGAWFLTMAHQLYAGVKRGEPVKPLRLFLQSNNYLAVVFCALAVDSALALPDAVRLARVPAPAAPLLDPDRVASCPASRRSLRPLDGLVGRRVGGGAAAAARSRRAMRSRAAARFCSWPRCSLAVTVSTPPASRLAQPAEHLVAQPLGHRPRAGHVEGQLDAAVGGVHPCPPGPEDLEKRSLSSAAGTTKPRVTTRSSATRDRLGNQHHGADGLAALQVGVRLGRVGQRVALADRHRRCVPVAIASSSSPARQENSSAVRV